MTIDLESIMGINDGAVDHALVELFELTLDDVLDGWETIERNLREKMMFSLVLHATHQQQPENIFVLVVSAGLDLMVDETHLRVFLVSDLIFVVTNQDEGSIEATDEHTNNPPDQILSKNIQTGVIGQNKDGLQLNKGIFTMLTDLREATKESNLHFKNRNSNR